MAQRILEHLLGPIANRSRLKAAHLRAKTAPVSVNPSPFASDFGAEERKSSIGKRPCLQVTMSQKYGGFSPVSRMFQAVIRNQAGMDHDRKVSVKSYPIVAIEAK